MSVQTGNQQPNVSDIQIGWLCGLIDGEGTLTLRWSAVRGKRYLAPFLQIANGDIATLDKCVEILSAIGVGHNVRWIDPAASRLTKRTYWTILVVGMKRLERLLPLIMPYLVTKQRQGHLVWEFIRERMSKNQRTEYGEVERRVLLDLHAITDKGKKPRSETWFNDRTLGMN
jgi:hypothetical protein